MKAQAIDEALRRGLIRRQVALDRLLARRRISISPFERQPAQKLHPKI